MGDILPYAERNAARLATACSVVGMTASAHPGATVNARSRVHRLLTCALGAAVFALVAVAAQATAAPAAHAATVHTIASTPAQIRRLAADGRRVAWMQQSATCGREVRVVDRTTGVVTAVGGGCQDTFGALASAYSGEVMLTIAGTRPTWSVLAGGGPSDTAVYVREADLAAADVVNPLNAFSHPNTGDEQMRLTGLAGRGTVRSYGIRNWSRPDPWTWVFGGTIHTIVGGSYVTLPGSSDPRMMAVAASRVISAREWSAANRLISFPADGLSGAQNFDVGGYPLAIAARRGIDVALVRMGDGTKQLRTFDAATHAMLAQRTVADSIGRAISTNGSLVVFRTGRTLKVMDAHTGAARRLVVTEGFAAGPLMEGCKVIWAEAFTGASYVRSTRAC